MQVLQEHSPAHILVGQGSAESRKARASRFEILANP